MLVPVPGGFYSVLPGSFSATSRIDQSSFLSRSSEVSICLCLFLSLALLLAFPGPVTCDDVDLYILVMDGAILADIHGIYSKGWLKKGLSMYPFTWCIGMGCFQEGCF